MQRGRDWRQAFLLSAVALATTLTSPALAGEPQAAGGTAQEEQVQRVTSADGTSIAYELSGQGPLLILVSPALSARGSQQGLAALLTDKFSLLVYDRRGRGDSGDTPPYDRAREVEDIEALIDAKGGRAFLFGSSSGAALALEAANALGDKVAGVALHEPPFIVDDSRPPMPSDFVAHVSALVAEGRRGDAVAYFMHDAVGVPEEFVAQMRQGPMWPGLEALAHTLAYEGLLLQGTQDGQPLPTDRWTSLKCGGILLAGGNSEPWMHTSARALAALLPQLRLEVIPDTDHSAVFMAPQTLVPAICSLLDAAAEQPVH